MATYRQVKGYNIKKVSSDPSNVKEGQIWYNSNSGAVKLGLKLEAWSKLIDEVLEGDDLVSASIKYTKNIIESGKPLKRIRDINIDSKGSTIVNLSENPYKVIRHGDGIL